VVIICYLGDAASIHTQRWATHFVERGYRIHVVSFTAGSIPGVEVHYVPPRVVPKAVGYLLRVPSIRNVVRRTQCDIIHAHYATSYGLVGALVGRHPLIISAWGSDVLITPQQSRLARMAVLFALRRADLVTSMAHHMTRTLVTMGVQEEKILTLPFGVDTEMFHPRSDSTRSEDTDVVCTRALEPIYNVEVLIRALAQAAKVLPGIRCALIGDGTLRPALQKLATDLGLQRQIVWLGRLSQSEVASWLCRSRVFVTPALSDGNNVSLNEAMACGAFPIAADIPANREWLTDGANGFLVPPHDPMTLSERILTALGSDEIRRKAADENWRIVRDRADWRQNMALMEEHYERLTS
jgi:L-malate glycosyltransferase